MLKPSVELRGASEQLPDLFLENFKKTRPSLLRANREKMPFEFHLYGLFCIKWAHF